MHEVIFFITMLLIFAAAVLFIPMYMTERATVKVVRMFREKQADDIWNARKPEELGLGPRGLVDRLADPRRDYKPVALQVLIKTGIIRTTGNGKLYLSEKGLADVCFKTENRLKVCSLA